MFVVYTTRNSSIRLYEVLSCWGISAEIVNTPRALSVGCGLSVKFRDCDYPKVRARVASLPSNGYGGIWRERSGAYERIY